MVASKQYPDLSPYAKNAPATLQNMVARYELKRMNLPEDIARVTRATMELQSALKQTQASAKKTRDGKPSKQAERVYKKAKETYERLRNRVEATEQELDQLMAHIINKPVPAAAATAPRKKRSRSRSKSKSKSKKSKSKKSKSKKRSNSKRPRLTVTIPSRKECNTLSQQTCSPRRATVTSKDGYCKRVHSYKRKDGKKISSGCRGYKGSPPRRVGKDKEDRKVYMTDTGRRYVNRISKNGNKYRQYVDRK